MCNMGTITANVDDGIEKVFRNRVIQVFGRRKGAIGKAFNEAMKEWSSSKEHMTRCMQLLHDGVDLGGVSYSKREELHSRH